MERNEWADRFVDCVVQRSQRDNVLGTFSMLLTMVLPYLIGMVILVLVFASDPEVLEGWSFDVATEVGLIAENCIAGYILLAMTRRSRKHLSRDLDWMDALIGYVGSHGMDTSGMEELRGRAAKGAWGARLAVAKVLWAIGVLFLIAVVLYLGHGDGPYDGDILMLVTLSYILLMIQFLFAVGATTGFPSRHDEVQCEFTRELKQRCEGFGLFIPAMERRVPKRHRVVRAVLFIVTLGLFSIPLLLLCNMHLNRHIRGQWSYEERLMDDIISFEGGSGIEGTGCNQPSSAVGRFLNNLMRSVDGLLLCHESMHEGPR